MTPYLKGESGSEEAPFPFDPFIYAAGGVVSSVRELATFMPQILGGAAVDDDGRPGRDGTGGPLRVR